MKGKTKGKRLLSILLVCMILLSLVPTVVFATGSDTRASTFNGTVGVLGTRVVYEPLTADISGLTGYGGDESNLSYEWERREDNHIPFGRYDKTFTPQSTGSYKVHVTYNGTTLSSGWVTVSATPPAPSYPDRTAAALSQTSFVYNGEAQGPSVTGVSASDVNISGDTSKLVTGSYTLTVTPKVQWSDGTTSAVNLTWSITPCMNAITIAPAAAGGEYIPESLPAYPKKYQPTSFTVTDSLLAGDSFADVTYTGERMYAGTTTSAIESYKIMRGTTDVTSCYGNITKGTGEIKVTPFGAPWPDENISVEANGAISVATLEELTGVSGITPVLSSGSAGSYDSNGYHAPATAGAAAAKLVYTIPAQDVDGDNVADVSMYKITVTINVTAASGRSVTIQAGTGMSTTGNAAQTGLTGAMTSVVYTAADTHYFPEDYSVASVNGITVTRNSYTEITVSGTPTANTTIELPAATAKDQESKPEAYTTGQTENSVLLNGAAPKCLYSIDGGQTWTKLNNYSVHITNVTTEHGIWVKCPTSNPNIGLDSEIQKITITKAATPAPTIDYWNERFDDLDARGTFSITVNGTTKTYTSNSFGRLKIAEDWIGQTISIVRQGGSNELYSAPKNITLSARPTTAPTGVTATDCTSDSPYIGSIDNVDDTMQISLKGEDGWLNVPEGETSVKYSYGEYEVRYKATDTNFASVSAYVTIKEYVAPINAETPTISTQPSAASYYMQGDSARALSVSASVSDGGTLSYQWYKNGTAISGATNTSYTPDISDVGSNTYYCVVTNTNSSATGNTKATVRSITASVFVSAPVHDHVWSSTWNANETHHWRICTFEGCSECDTPAAHTPGAAATETSAQTCTVCERVLAAKLTHAPMLVEGYEATTEAPGKKDYYHCDSCGKNYADVTSMIEIEGDVEEWRVIPMIIDIVEGDGQVWTKGTNVDLTFKSNANFTNFTRVEVDNVEVAPENYTVIEGSTVVTLKASFLETLSVGEHTIVIVSANDVPEAKFTVKAAATGGNTGNEQNPDTGATSPQTGDNSNMFLWIALLFVSLGGLTTTIVYKKRKAAK